MAQDNRVFKSCNDGMKDVAPDCTSTSCGQVPSHLKAFTHQIQTGSSFSYIFTLAPIITYLHLPFPPYIYPLHPTSAHFTLSSAEPSYRKFGEEPPFPQPSFTPLHPTYGLEEWVENCEESCSWLTY